MSSKVSPFPPDRISSAFRELADAATRLNTASDALAEAVSPIDAALKKLNLGLFELSLSKEYSKIIIGIAILVAVAVDQLSEHLRNRRLAGAKRK